MPLGRPSRECWQSKLYAWLISFHCLLDSQYPTFFASASVRNLPFFVSSLPASALVINTGFQADPDLAGSSCGGYFGCRRFGLLGCARGNGAGLSLDGAV